jgi:molybdate transport system substrate-binding protein
LPRAAPLALLLALAAPAVAGGAARALTVAGAASLRPAAEDLARGFEAENPGVRVALAFGASGTLFAQIRGGAPFDLFLSADRNYPARLVAAGLAAAADERVYGRGRLVAWLPPGSTLDVAGRGLAALANPGVRRIAIANPAVAPYGRAAEEALRAAGVLGAVKDRLVLGTSVAQAAQFASTGAADVALLPSTLARSKGLEKGQVVPVPEALSPPVEQSALVLASARDPALARAFLDFLTGAKGMAILARHGYGPP